MVKTRGTEILIPAKYQCINCNISLCCLQSFGGSPSVFVSAKYARSTKPDDAMYIWLENVNSGSFEVCIREFLPFDGKHQDTIVVRVVRRIFFVFLRLQESISAKM